MLKDIRLLIDKINRKYKQTKLWKSIVRMLSLITIFITIYSLIMPALTLNSEQNYTLHLLDSYNYTWKESLTNEYNLNLYFMDTNGNYIGGKDVTIEIGPNALVDDPYGFD